MKKILFGLVVTLCFITALPLLAHVTGFIIPRVILITCTIISVTTMFIGIGIACAGENTCDHEE